MRSSIAVVVAELLHMTPAQQQKHHHYLIQYALNILHKLRLFLAKEHYHPMHENSLIWKNNA